MKFIPHEYQKRAIQHILEHKRAALFLEMGLGKTVVTLTALSELEYRKSLVIAPKRVIHTWQDEVMKWNHTNHLEVSVITGSRQQRERALNDHADLYLISRDNITWLVNHYGKKWPFDLVIIDELSSFKASSTKRFRSLRKILPFVDES